MSPDRNTGDTADQGGHRPAYVPRMAAHRKGELIFSEGASGQNAYIVRRGEVQVVKHTGSQGQVVLKTLGPGELFGEMALITANPRSASVVAVTDVELEVLDRDTFAQKLRSDTEFSVRMVQRLAAMVPDTQDRLMKHFEQTGTGRSEVAAPRLSWWQRLTGLGQAQALHAGFEPAHVRIEQDQSDRLLGLGVAATTLLLLGGLLAAFWIELDQVVVASGRIVTQAAAITVQTVETGTVRQVHVREGQHVKQGERLLTLDPTVADADLDTVRAQWQAASAQRQRVQAEISGQLRLAPTGHAREDAWQQRLLLSHRQQHLATLAGHDAELAALQRQLASREAEIAPASQQLQVSRERADIRHELQEKEQEAYQRNGIYRLQALEARQALGAAERDLTGLRGQIDHLRAQLTARQAQREVYLSTWRARLEDEESQHAREQARLGEQLRKLERSQQLMTLVAPGDGVVLAVRAKVAGTVVRAAEPVVDMVADGSALEVEVDVQPRDIAHVKAGRQADIKLDTLPFVRHGSLQGTVLRVSEDSFERTLNSAPGPVFRARLQITGNRLHDTPPGFALQPGMTLNADIVAGRRPLSAVIFYPVAKALGTGLKEP